ncbi:MAG: hypothetical protein D3916_17720, partial [Candidatus Electrothrix sp. MAN1_4]|nr:hypothetical protein [Candidatus Electrothrix sp. MAN1_4]
MQWVTRLHRIEHAGMPVYIDQDKPDWFVPSSRADALLRACQQHDTQVAAVAAFCHRHRCNEDIEQAEQAGRDLCRLEHL